jgi:WD40 repeat protein
MSRHLAAALLAGLTLTPGWSAGPPDRPAPGTDSFGDPLPPAARARVGTVRLLQGGHVLSLAFSRDGKLLFAAGADARLRAWRTATGNEAPFFKGDPGPTTCLAVSPDGRLLASAGTDRTLRVWDLLTGRVVKSWRGGASACPSVAFTPDGKVVAWVDDQGALRRRDLASDKEAPPLKKEPGLLGALTFSRDGKRLAALEGDGRVVLWDLASGKRLRTYGDSEGHGIVRFGGGPLAQLRPTVLFSSDDKSLVASAFGGPVRVWDAESVEELRQLESAGGGGAREDVSLTLAFSPNGKALAAGGMDGSIQLWTFATGKALQALKAGESPVTALAFSPDGKTLATGGAEGRIRLWDLASGKEKLPAGDRPAPFTAIGFRGANLVTFSPGAITHWSASTGKQLRRLPVHGGEVRFACLSPDGKLLALAGDDQRVRLLDTARGTARHEWKAFSEHGALLAFSPDGRLLAGTSPDASATVRLWSTATGKDLPSLRPPQPGGMFLALAFSPDGRTVLASHPDEPALARWELATRKQRRPFRLPGGSRRGAEEFEDFRLRRMIIMRRMAMMRGRGGMMVDVAEEVLRALAVSPDGRLLALGQQDTVSLCSLAADRLVLRLVGHSGPVTAVAFSPGGKLLATGAQDTTVRLWEVRTGRPLAKLEGHRGAVQHVTFSPDGKSLLSAGEDATALAWDVAAAVRLGTAPPARPRAARPPEALWADLASDDPAVAESAMDELEADPGVAVPLFRRHLAPAPPVDHERLRRLIHQLGSDRFAEREDATRQVEAFGELAGPALRALPRPRNAEAARRVKQLLTRLDARTPAGAEARPLRAVEVLERAGTPEARKLLAALARGAPEARLTRDARDALSRLAKRE